MPTREAILKGAATSKVVCRQRSLSKYYENPNHCKECGKVIRVRDNQKVSETRTKKFCNKSCAARFNSRGVSRRSDVRSEGICRRCGEIIKFKKKPWGYGRRRLCDSCLQQTKHGSTFRIVKKIKTLSKSKKQLLKTKQIFYPNIELITKEELLFKHKNYFSFKSAISAHARKVFQESGKSTTCPICGYNYKNEVCHIKEVKDFPDDALIGEINHPDNLVSLCRTHHWELDHKILKLS